MEKLVIRGGNPLKGSVNIGGAKNSSLPILACSLLAEGKYNIKNVPYLRDVKTMNKLLISLGLLAEHKDGEVFIENNNNLTLEASYDLVKTMRASILVLGPLLAKNGKAKVSLPGGCAIGERPVDLHISALEKMGANIDVKDGYIYAEANKLKGTEIIFDKITVTGTENVLMAATLADGRTILKNAAEEPEIQDLANFLRVMGAKIEGDGTNTIIIDGVDKLKASNYEVMSDRIEAGTFLCAVAGCGGDVVINNCPVSNMDAIIEKVKAAGAEVNIIDDKTIHIKSNGNIKATNIQTAPYPGFPTDMQAQFMAVMLKSDGVSIINESIFENRFMHVSELKRMGCDISLKDSNAIVHGVESFSGAPVMASDLRASAGLVIAGLMAKSFSEVLRIYHLDRGYESFEKKLVALGADIKREYYEE